MSHEAKQNLIEAMHDFILNTPDNKHQQPLQTWLRILSHANWALNAFLILKPALNSSYDKISGKTMLSQGVCLNKHIHDDMLWFTHSINHLDGVRLFKAEEWSAHEAELEIWSDTCKDGLSFF